MSVEERQMNADARSPLAGCAILVIALLVMIFLVVFSTITLFRQFNEIAKFTDEAPKPIEVSTLEGEDLRVNRLAEKLEAFRQELSGDQEARLELTADEINLAIAMFPKLQELRGTFRVMSLTDDGIRIRISFPLNGKPRLTKDGEDGFMASDKRYLNGVLLARPALLKHELILKLDGIEVDNEAKVPVEFVEQMSPYRLAERYLNDPLLGPAMAKLTRVETKDGVLVMARVLGERLVDDISDEEVDHAGSRFFMVLGGAACLFLLFAGVMIVVGLRNKAKSEDA